VIYLGVRHREKPQIIADFMRSRSLAKCKIVGPLFFPLATEFERIDWSQIIKYKFFYRLLGEIDSDTLVVVNECLRTTNRSDLTYNCIRHYLSQTSHVLVFQWLPLLESINDLMILVDFDSRSRWKGVGWSNWQEDPSVPSRFVVTDRTPLFSSRIAKSSASLCKKYAAMREKMFESPGSDLHAIPRNIHMLAGQERMSLLTSTEVPVVRNKRLEVKSPVGPEERNSIIYGDEEINPNQFSGRSPVIVDFPHSHRDMSDFLSLAECSSVSCATTDLKVDQWYLNRYLAWSLEIKGAYSEIQRRNRC